AFAVAALAGLRAAAVPGWEKVAFLAFGIELGFLSADIWTGHAYLRSINEVYLFAVLILLGGRNRRLPALAWCAGVTALIAAIHQALFL
ncbi:MAG: hypothetical protein ACLP52_13040, partial [Streptosporangiaceae bacterium]